MEKACILSLITIYLFMICYDHRWCVIYICDSTVTIFCIVLTGYLCERCEFPCFFGSLDDIDSGIWCSLKDGVFLLLPIILTPYFLSFCHSDTFNCLCVWQLKQVRTHSSGFWMHHMEVYRSHFKISYQNTACGFQKRNARVPLLLMFTMHSYVVCTLCMYVAYSMSVTSV